MIGVYFGRRNSEIKVGASSNVAARAEYYGLELIGVIECPRKIVYHVEWAAYQYNLRYQIVNHPDGKEWYLDRSAVIEPLIRPTILLPHLGTSLRSDKREAVASFLILKQKRMSR